MVVALGLALAGSGCSRGDANMPVGFHCAFPAPARTAVPFRLFGRVSNWPSGDTLELATEDGLHAVRILGIDSPEFGQEMYSEARSHLMKTVRGEIVTAEVLSIDPVQLCTGTIRVAGRDLGLQMLEAGMAWHTREEGIDNAAYAAALRNARLKKLGIWEDDKAVPPWQWRPDR